MIQCNKHLEGTQRRSKEVLYLFLWHGSLRRPSALTRTRTHAHTHVHTHTHTHKHTHTHTHTHRHTHTHASKHSGSNIKRGAGVKTHELVRLQHTATHYNTLQHRQTLQHSATHCNTLQYSSIVAPWTHELALLVGSLILRLKYST